MSLFATCLLLGGCPLASQTLDGQWEATLTGTYNDVICLTVEDGLIVEIDACARDQPSQWGIVFGIRDSNAKRLGRRVQWSCDMDYLPAGDAVLSVSLTFDLIIQCDGSLEGTLVAQDRPNNSAEWTAELRRR